MFGKLTKQRSFLQKITAFCLSAVLCVPLITSPLIASAEGDSLAMLEDNGIPVVYVNIDENAEGYGTIAQMHESMDHSVKCTGTVKIDVPDGYKGDYSDTVISDTGDLQLEYIRGRGNSTWLQNKNPYKFKLAKKANILGMGKNKHWTLLANYFDRSMLKNRIVYNIGRELGMEFTPKGLPVDLVINGEYYGSYFLAEEIRVDENRVELDEMAPDDTTEPNITGGYLLAMKPYPKEPSQNVFWTNNINLKTVYPDFSDAENYDQTTTPAQMQYISDYISNLESAVLADDFKDANGIHYSEYMNLQSTADFWWIQEITQNQDGYDSPSNYLYKKRNGKLYWGPLWDMDRAFKYEPSYKFYMDRLYWLEKMREFDPMYQQTLRERWSVLSDILTEYTKEGGKIDRYVAEIKNSWLDDYALKKYSDPSDKEPLELFNEEVEHIRNFITGKKNWIDENIDSELTHMHDTITFMADGEVISTKVMTANSVLNVYSLPSMPAKEGFIAACWERDDGVIFTDGMAITRDTTFNVKYVSAEEANRIGDIYFSNYEYYIKVTDSYFKPRLTVTPYTNISGLVKWSSSDNSIAEVDENGSVHPKAEGYVTITGSFENGKSNSYTLHVLPSDAAINFNVKSAVLDITEMKLKVGEYGQAKIDILPKPTSNPSLQFKSSDTSVAEIDSNGVVLAKAPGTATIEVAYYTSFKTTYTVTVEAAEEGYIIGDADGSGIVDIKDCVIMQKSIIGIAVIDDKNLQAADVNGDNKVTVIDVVLVMRYLVGYTDNYNVGKRVVPEKPTDAPTEPTQPTTDEPTQQPTEAPTQPPTEAPTIADRFLYFDASAIAKGDERWALYVWNDSGSQWINMTGSDNLYQSVLPSEYTNFIIVRMNGATADNNWENKWNQTVDLTYSDSANLVIATGWNGAIFNVTQSAKQ